MSLTLDVGSGSRGFGLRCLGDINVDIGRPTKKPGKIFIQCDAEALPFRNKVFSRVTMFDVVEHVNNPTKALKEIKRVMSDDGIFILGTPNVMRITNFLHILMHGYYIPHKDHVAVWGRIELINLFDRVGFSAFSVKACTCGDTKHGMLANIALRASSFRQDLTGRQLIATAVK